MWGSLNDFAKKAAELQEQAERAAAAATTSGGAASLFSLDSLQRQQQEEKPKPKAPPPVPVTQPAASVAVPLVASPRKSPAAPKGKLKIPAVSTPIQAPRSAFSSKSSGVAPVVSKNNADEAGAVAETKLQAPPLLGDSSVVEKSQQPKSVQQDETGGGKDEMPPTADSNSSSNNSEEAVSDEQATLPKSKEDDQEEEEATEAKKFSLILLTSSTARRFQQDTAAAITVLTAHKIDYETVDCCDATMKPLKDKLLATLPAVTTNPANGQQPPTSPRNGFPYFFWICLATGQPEYSGSYPDFCERRDAVEGLDTWKAPHMLLLPEQETEHVTPTTQETPVAVQEQVEPSFREKQAPEPKDENKADEEEAAVRFAAQLARMQENFVAEQAATAAAHQQALADQEERHAASNEELTNLRRKNEGYRLRLDALQREVDGTRELLEARDADLTSQQDGHATSLQGWKDKLAAAERETAVHVGKVKEAEGSLQKARGELETAHKDHVALQQRAREVAMEVKERRQQCQALLAAQEKWQDEKDNLNGEIEKLEYQLSGHNQSSTARSNEVAELRAEVANGLEKIKELQEIVDTKDASNEKALTEYKKMAQNKLALANSRTAAATQSKEESELEARAARSTADTAMERAVNAEIEAKTSIQRMKREEEAALRVKDQALADLDTARQELAEVQQHLEKESSRSAALESELQETYNSLSQEHQRSLLMEKEKALVVASVEGLREELSSTKAKLRQAEVASSKPVATPAVDLTAGETTMESKAISFQSADEDRENLAILQSELASANRVIADLKSALKNAVESNEPSPYSQSNETMGGAEGPGSPAASGPLFYAMEKQAELNTARSEINRLASMLSNVQSERMEAVEAMADMKQRMEDAQSRLHRYEKLRPGDQQNGSSNGDAAAINIEYLKNIVLRYLNATTVPERKALVPVLGAVLCLTPDEQKRASECVESSESLGNSFLESISESWYSSSK